MARVVYRDENYQTFYVDVNDQQPEVTIGRNQGNMIVIPAKSLSRYHAKIIYQNRKYFLVDLKSSNGSYVNGQRVTNHEIHPGDKIQFGDVVVEFIDDNRGASVAPTAASVPPQRPAAPPKMGMPKLQMFNPSVALSAGHDVRNVSMRPITSQGNYRPTMPNQPAFDDDMAKLVANQGVVPQPPAIGMPPKPPKPGMSPSLVAPPGAPSLDSTIPPSGAEIGGMPQPPRLNSSNIPEAVGGPSASSGFGQMPNVPQFGGPSLNGTPTSGPHAGMGGMPSMPSGMGGMPSMPSGMGGMPSMPSGMGGTVPSGGAAEQMGDAPSAADEKAEATHVAYVNDVDGARMESTSVAHMDEISSHPHATSALEEMPSADDDVPSVPDQAPVLDDDVPSVPDQAPVLDDDVPSVPDQAPVLDDDVPSVPDQAPVLEESSVERLEQSQDASCGGEEISEMPASNEPETFRPSSTQDNRTRMRQRSTGREHAASGESFAPASAGVGRRAARTGFFRAVDPAMTPSGSTSNIAAAVPTAGNAVPQHSRGRGAGARPRYTHFAHKTQDIASDVVQSAENGSASANQAVVNPSSASFDAARVSSEVPAQQNELQDMGLALENPADALPEFINAQEPSEDHESCQGAPHGEIQETFEALHDDEKLKDDESEGASDEAVDRDLASERLDALHEELASEESQNSVQSEPAQDIVEESLDNASVLADDPAQVQALSEELAQTKLQLHSTEAELLDIRSKLDTAYGDIENHQKMLSLAQAQNQTDTRTIADLEERIQQMEVEHEEEIAASRARFDTTFEEKQLVIAKLQEEAEDYQKTIDKLQSDLETASKTPVHSEDTEVFRSKWTQRFNVLLQYAKAMERAVDRLALEEIEPKSAEYIRSMTDMIRFCADDLK